MSKVLLVNAGPHKEGNTMAALSEVAKQLEKNGVDAEIVQVGVKPVRSCIACGPVSYTHLRAHET